MEYIFKNYTRYMIGNIKMPSNELAEFVYELLQRINQLEERLIEIEKINKRLK